LSLVASLANFRIAKLAGGNVDEEHFSQLWLDFSDRSEYEAKTSLTSLCFHFRCTLFKRFYCNWTSQEKKIRFDAKFKYTRFRVFVCL